MQTSTTKPMATKRNTAVKMTFSDLKEFSDRLGQPYGTEDFCHFLYSLIKMHKPANLLEIGTGFGATALWMGQALKENKKGHLWTIDDGSDWKKACDAAAPLMKADEQNKTHKDYFQDLLTKFELAEQVTLHSNSVPPYPVANGKWDLIFSDFKHNPEAILELLAHFLPSMAECSSLFIDSASTCFESYLLLENIVAELNRGVIPRTLLAMIKEDERAKMMHWIRQIKFTLVHITEAKDRPQNSTAWIKIEPVDIRPYPSTPFHSTGSKL